MKLFLTSSVHAVAHDITKKVNLSKAKKLVFIDTAAEIEEGDKTWLKNDRQALMDAGFEVDDYSITGKSVKYFWLFYSPCNRRFFCYYTHYKPGSRA